MESAIAGGEQLAAQLLEELSDWEPGVITQVIFADIHHIKLN
ncbi:MAG: hypothetical protein RM049_18570 [Nostoc sp. DedQUE04]|nr:hypothetical protein [Nostoc sp. DedQUE04]